jgi:TolB protein
MRKVLVLLIVPFVLVMSAAAQSDSGVQLAISGADGNIYLYDVASDELRPVTNDASFQNPARFYDWPTWSSDGQLAFFGTNLDPENFFGLGIYIMPPGGEPKGVFSAPNEVFTYAYWSPGDCPAGNCRDLAVLYSSDAGLAARMVRSADEFSVNDLAQGGPFYWDWSPDGSSMFWARFGTTLEIYDVASQEVEVLDEVQGLAQAVDWSPVDDRLLAGIQAEDGTTTLTVIDGDERLELATGISGVIALEWSPDGRYAGMLIRNTGELYILDTQTGEQVAMPGREVLAFFWAPDSNQMAYIAIDTGNNGPGAKRIQPGIPQLQWRVYSVDTEANVGYASFLPSEDMTYYLSFFDQFARSHRLWSADSRYLVFGERTNSGERVSLIDITGDGRAQTITEGGIGIFEW